MTWTVPSLRLVVPSWEAVGAVRRLRVAFGQERRPDLCAGAVAGRGRALVLVEVVEGEALASRPGPARAPGRWRPRRGPRRLLRRRAAASTVGLRCRRRPCRRRRRRRAAVAAAAAAGDRQRARSAPAAPVRRWFGPASRHVLLVELSLAVAPVASTGATKVRSPAWTPIARVRERSSAELSTAFESSPQR